MGAVDPPGRPQSQPWVRLAEITVASLPGSRGETTTNISLLIMSCSSNTLLPPQTSQEKTKSRTPTLPVRVPDITKRVRSESVPRSFGTPDCNEKVEVVKVLSTAGTGLKRENEKVEALSNINRFITMDKVKRDDAVRVENDKAREVQKLEIKIVPAPVQDSSYVQVKQEQIKMTNERALFLNNAEKARIPKSPEPFRGRQRDLSEGRTPQEGRRIPPLSKPPPPPGKTISITTPS